MTKLVGLLKHQKTEDLTLALLIPALGKLCVQVRHLPELAVTLMQPAHPYSTARHNTFGRPSELVRCLH